MNKEKVSIIIPVYNSEKYIGRCIDSILNQTYTNYELILIDDGSTDNSLKILNDYKKKDNRIRVYSQKNKGVAITRNRGIKLSNGQYICFIDNDDYIENKYLENLVSNCCNNDFVIGGYKRVSDDKILFKKKLKNTNFSKFENVAPWGKLIKKSYLINNKIEFFSFPIGEDIIFNIKLFSLTTKFKIINNCDYNWYFNNDSVSNTKQKKFNNNIIIFFDKMKELDADEITGYFICRYKIWYLLFSGKNVTPKEFIEEYKKINLWLNSNNYNKKISIKKILKNEVSIKNKLIISLFYVLEKFKLINLFSKIYCKG